MADLKNEGSMSNSGIVKRTNFLAQPKLLKASTNPFRRITDESSSKVDSCALFAPLPNPITSEEDGTNTTVPKFVPLQTSKNTVSFAGGTNATPTGLSRATGFVFGQNLKERIVNRPGDDDGEGPSSSSSTSVDHLSSNGSSNFLFSAAVQNTENKTPPKPVIGDGSSLAQSAHTWERIRDTSLPPIPPQQQVVTGEEGEINKLQMNCRLYAFEGGVWKERGRCQLRLNDSDIKSSRLVCRSTGSLRILLNTKIWGGMTVEKPGSKSLRITATDSLQQLKVFLIMASPDEVSQLHEALSHRVSKAKKSEENGDVHKSSKSESALNENKSSNESQLPDTSDAKLPEEKAFNEAKEEDDDETNESESAISKSKGNPVVIISADDDDNSENRETLKRSQTDGHSSVPKKMCMEFPSEDIAHL